MRLRFALTLGILLLPSWFAVAQPPPARTQVTVIVHDGQGAPIPQAQVMVHDMGDPDFHAPWQLVGLTAADGRCVVEKLPEGVYDLRVEATGFAVHWQREIRVEGGKPVELRVVLPRVGAIRGRLLLPDGQPAAERELAVRFDRNTPGQSFLGDATANTDAEGNFRLPLEPGEHDLAVRLAGVGYALLPKFTVETGRDLAVGDVTLVRFATITGSVRSQSTGQPLAGVKVQRSYFGNSLFSMRPLDPVKTDAPGRFTMDDLWAGEWMIVAAAADYARKAAEGTVKVGSGETVEGVTIALERACTLTVRVVDADGNPVRNAEAWLYWEGKRPVDADGRVSFEGLTPGKLKVTAGAPDWASMKRDVQLAEGETTEVTLSLTLRGGTIRGTVRNALTGAPLKDVLIGVMEDAVELEFGQQTRFDVWIKPFIGQWGPAEFRLHRWRSQEHLEATTAADGTYTLSHVAAGEYTVCAIADGYINETVESTRVKENETTTVDFGLAVR
ncbi:MAG: hypothetical protein AUJ96_07295 [Armatimonadetes bacterium CG2_30_66_41]|nr:hypothetical protein [Armatimonadota bacterium]OIP07526.1 MAG: hypothetical protein AUJ96_07295 [Armatimonadetes bacterium CG2_30_66_41]PIX38340.1 MAG: hypothetical protein COZ57_30770 [Armatimonadetes bacterium CG_4_8_14_3_um_filter_66_20]PJB61055.1 MAG: hypothetical protein CO096_30750 [Armatimonadetes bacterium CG_4_9_14_3_um_filter_66_14]NCO94070.1 hypothetical protein [Armatimonadota bacterium]